MLFVIPTYRVAGDDTSFDGECWFECKADEYGAFPVWRCE